MSTIPNKASFHFEKLSVDICNTQKFNSTFRVYTDTESGDAITVHHHMPIIRVTLGSGGRIVTHHSDQSITHTITLNACTDKYDDVSIKETSEVCI